MSRTLHPGAKGAPAASSQEQAAPRPKTASSEALRRAYREIIKQGLI